MHELENLTEELIIVAHDLSPLIRPACLTKMSLLLPRILVAVRRIQRSWLRPAGVPAVVGLKDATLRISNQDLVIVDGRMGLVIVLIPNDKTLSLYRAEKDRINSMRNRFDDIKDLPAETTDGRKVEVPRI